VAYGPEAGGSGNQAYLQANLTSSTNAFPSSGSYAITAKYNGDANYSASTSPADEISVMYPTPNVLVTPTQQSASYGATAAVTALIDTTNKTVYPTGTVTFADAYSGTIVAGPTTCANAKDTSGNFACQAVGSFTVTSSDPVAANYSGDGNYPASSATAYINMSDFTINPQGGVSVTAGQSQNLTIAINSLNGFTGTVTNFACSGLPTETTCTFNPTQVTPSSNGTVTTTLTFTTTAIGQSRNRAALGGGRGWGMTEAALLLGVCFIGIPLSRRRRPAAALILAASLFVLPSCGGGGSGVPPNPVPAISSLNPTQVAAGSQVQNLYINGTNFLSSSTVTYNGTIRNSSLQSATQLQIPLGPNDVAAAGQYPVIVTNPTPGGGPSAPVNFAVVTGTPTGNFNVTLTASSGQLSHNTTVSVTVQ
jgi:hypothetical protein